MSKIVFFTFIFISLCLGSGGFAAKWNPYPLKKMEIIYPADKALSNPPFIHWQAVKGADKYHVVVKNSKVFVDAFTENNFYTPVNPLPEGKYKVTVSLAKGKSEVFTRSKDFNVGRSKRNYKQELNHIKIDNDKQLLFSEKTVNRIKTDKSESDYLKRFLAYARGPGWNELKNFSEPAKYKDGVWDLKTWQNNNTLCFKIEKRVLGQILAYKITGEKVFLNNAMRIINKIVDWNAAGATGVWENDHSAQALLYTLSLTYNAFKNDVSKTEKEKMIKAIELRSKDMYKFLNPFIRKKTSAGLMNDPENNHPWFCTSALGYGGFALAGVVPEAQQWAEFAAQMFDGVYLPRGGSKGGWHEGIDYWSYNLFFVFQFCDALKNVSGVNLYKYPWLKNTDIFEIYCHPPVGGYVPFGDCKHTMPTGFDKVVMMRLASEYKNTLDWKYIDAIPAKINDTYLFYALLWGNRVGINTTGKVSVPFAYDFKDIGWVVSNNSIFNADKQILFAMRSGKYFGEGDNHSHADQNNFIITAGGDKLIWDAGYYKHYLDKHHKNYTRLSIAHNTILVDGVGQAVYTPGADGKITEFDLNGTDLVVKGDASNPKIYNGRVKKFIRTVSYKNEKDFVVKDEIVLSKPGRISYLLHSVYPIEFNAEDNTICIKGEHYQLKGKFKSDVKIESSITNRFPVEPEDKLPEQYHMELKTKTNIKQWYPELTFSVTKINIKKK